jgi:hypothetical protein
MSQLHNPHDSQEAGWRAFVDESESDRKADPDTYILAAALIEPCALDEIRTKVRGLLIPRQRKMHWHDESTRRRDTIIQAIADLEALHVVVVRSGIPEETSERRRRKCLERMVCELDQRGVDLIVAESREKSQNARDMKVFNVLRSSQTIGSQLRLCHQPGPVEPALWIADAVAGAYVAARTGVETFFKSVEHLVDVVELPRDC